MPQWRVIPEWQFFLGWHSFIIDILPIFRGVLAQISMPHHISASWEITVSFSLISSYKNHSLDPHKRLHSLQNLHWYLSSEGQLFSENAFVIGKHLLNRQITVNKMEFRKQVKMGNSQLILYCPSSVAIYCLPFVLFYVWFYTTFITVVSECLPIVHIAMWLASVTRCLFPYLLPRENCMWWGAICFGKAQFL